MAAVDLNTVRSTIEARLATELASSPAIPVVFNNMAFDSTTEDTFVQCQTSFGSGSYLTMGGSANSTNNVVGLLLINIFTEEGLDRDWETKAMLLNTTGIAGLEANSVASLPSIVDLTVFKSIAAIMHS